MKAVHSLYHSAGFQEIVPYPESEIHPEYRWHVVFMEKLLQEGRCFRMCFEYCNGRERLGIFSFRDPLCKLAQTASHNAWLYFILGSFSFVILINAKQNDIIISLRVKR